MKTTFREILEAKQGLGRLLEQQLPAAQAIKLARLVKQLNAELALFSEQQRRIAAPSVACGDSVSAAPSVACGDSSPACGGAKDTAQEEEMVRKLEELLAVEVEIDSDRVKLTLKEIDAGTVLATGAFVEIEEATE